MSTELLSARLPRSGLVILSVLLILMGFPLGFPVRPGLCQPAAEPEDFIEGIIRKVYLAYGGRESLASPQANCIIKGKRLQYPGSGAGAEDIRIVRKGGRVRVDSRPHSAGDSSDANLMAGVKSLLVLDSSTGWQIEGKRVVELDAEKAQEVLAAVRHHPSLLNKFGKEGYRFSLKGKTSFRHSPVFAVEVERDARPPVTLYVDRSNYLVVGASLQPHAAKTAGTGFPPFDEIEYRQYRPVAGTLLPFKETFYRDGSPVCELTAVYAALDKTVDDTNFAPPGENMVVKLTGPVVIPFQYSHDEILVTARINDGEPLEFLFDTGASDTIIDRRTAAEHFLGKEGQAEIRAAAGNVLMRTSQIRKLKIGSCIVKEVGALILDLTPQSRQLGRRVAGIIGNNILSRFVVTIDFGQEKITLEDPDTYKADTTAGCSDFDQARGPVIEAKLPDGKSLKFLIDTGAAFNHLPADIARRFAKGKPAHITEAVGLDGRPVRLGKLVLDGLELGGKKVKNVSFTYRVDQSPPAEQKGFFKRKEMGILGNPFWQNFTMILDYKFQKLYLKPNEVEKIRARIKNNLTAGDTKLFIRRDYRQAKTLYEKGLACAEESGDDRAAARFLGRLGNLYRILSRQLKRPEQAKVAYDYFVRGQELARKTGDGEIEGRILADWSLLYSDKGQLIEAKRMIDRALSLAPQEPHVNVDFAVHLYRRRLFADMQRYVEKALFLDPSNWQALWYQVKLAEMFHNKSKLETTLKEILRFYPWSELAKKKMEMLKAQPSIPPVTG